MARSAMFVSSRTRPQRASLGVGRQVVTQAGPFLFGEVLGRKHKEGGLLVAKVVEVVEQD